MVVTDLVVRVGLSLEKNIVVLGVSEVTFQEKDLVSLFEANRRVNV